MHLMGSGRGRGCGVCRRGKAEITADEGDGGVEIATGLKVLRGQRLEDPEDALAVGEEEQGIVVGGKAGEGVCGDGHGRGFRKEGGGVCGVKGGVGDLWVRLAGRDGLRQQGESIGGVAFDLEDGFRQMWDEVDAGGAPVRKQEQGGDGIAGGDLGKLVAGTAEGRERRNTGKRLAEQGILPASGSDAHGVVGSQACGESGVEVVERTLRFGGFCGELEQGGQKEAIGVEGRGALGGRCGGACCR